MFFDGIWAWPSNVVSLTFCGLLIGLQRILARTNLIPPHLKIHFLSVILFIKERNRLIHYQKHTPNFKEHHSKQQNFNSFNRKPTHPLSYQIYLWKDIFHLLLKITNFDYPKTIFCHFLLYFLKQIIYLCYCCTKELRIYKLRCSWNIQEGSRWPKII